MKEVHRAVELHVVPVVPGKVGDILLAEPERCGCNGPYRLAQTLSDAQVLHYLVHHEGHYVVRRVGHLRPDVLKISVDSVDLVAFARTYLRKILLGERFEDAENAVNPQGDEDPVLAVRGIDHVPAYLCGQFQEEILFVLRDEDLRLFRVLNDGHHLAG